MPADPGGLGLARSPGTTLSAVAGFLKKKGGIHRFDAADGASVCLAEAGPRTATVGICAAALFFAAIEWVSADDQGQSAALSCALAPGATVMVTRSIRLPPDCTLRRIQFVIAASGVTLDCNHAVLHGLLGRDAPLPYGRPYPEADAPRDAALLIATREGDESLHDITIRNCSIRNYRDGADVMLQLDAGTRQSLRQTMDPAPIEDRLRLQAPRNITFENVTIDFAHKSGLFINRYVTRVAFRDGAVTNSGNAAIYLNSGATGNEISGSLFAANGYYDYSDSERERNPKSPATVREAIAVDSSARNVIRGNRFRGNAAGAVFLYKNCWEHWQQPDQLPRNMHSSDNLIEANRFVDEPVGVWIASRRSRDLAGFDCGDPPIHEQWNWFRNRRYYRDYAERTMVRSNLFENVGYGIRVEDEGARLIDNRFSGEATANIQIGGAVGAKVGTVVRDTQVRGNTFDNRAHPIGPAERPGDAFRRSR